MRVLVVDDDPAVSGALNRALRLEGYEVTTAGDGPQALEFIADDECVEVTQKSVRLRKVVLDQHTRGRTRSKARNAKA